MYSSYEILKKYIHYWLTAQNGKGHGIHAPFVYQLVRQVLRDRSDHPAFEGIEAIRKRLSTDNTILNIEDYGAGSATGLTKQRRVKDIARSSLKSPKYARLLFRLAKFVEAKHIIELGTSLGITTAYLASADPDIRITSFEGASSIAAIASDNFKKLTIGNINIVEGNFDQQVPAFINQSNQAADLVYIDGNHTYEATIRYFHWFLSVANENTVLVFDDIHWSSGMEKAWKEICSHPNVTLTIDVFFLGFVFFRKAQLVPQHFTIRY